MGTNTDPEMVRNHGSRIHDADELGATLSSRADFGQMIYGEPIKFAVAESPNPLAEMLRGLPDGTFVTITMELKTPGKS